ncbi:MAG TPA: pyridoxamine 5'-phosphate oxidase family protein, partial [Acidimicrobiales bacterium]|nr:pyridoxamine 5'-phosphate oxidase family protein [Acidimicrobiales bacterium]
PLTHQECLALLASSSIGHLAVQVGHYPQVFTVNYRLDGQVIVFRSNAGTKLQAADHANVAFHVDHVDPVTRTGWSVLVQGMAEDVTNHRADPNRDRAEALDIAPWVADGRSHLVRVIPAHITGRRIGPGAAAFWTLDAGSYL